MKRYNRTPNRLSHISGNIQPSKRYTNNYFPYIIFVLAIALIIILVVYKSCSNNATDQQSKTEHYPKIEEFTKERNKSQKVMPRNKSEFPVDTTPTDSLPPETNLKILADEY